MALRRVHGAKLLIAKLDRLARNVAFIADLTEAGVEFEAVVMAALAEYEAKAISDRTKAALAAAYGVLYELAGL